MITQPNKLSIAELLKILTELAFGQDESHLSPRDTERELDYRRSLYHHALDVLPGQNIRIIGPADWRQPFEGEKVAIPPGAMHSDIHWPVSDLVFNGELVTVVDGCMRQEVYGLDLRLQVDYRGRLRRLRLSRVELFV